MNESRHKLEETSMILIYISVTYFFMGLHVSPEKLICDYLNERYEKINIFVKEALIKSLIYRDQLINDLQDNMPNWKFERINRLAQAIMLLAVTHYRYIEKIDKRIVIDNAVRLAKKYLDDGDYRLINAVLDATL